MKVRMGKMLIFLLVTLLTAPAFAATYDASGDWTIAADSGQTITLLNSLLVPAEMLSVGVNITQPADGDTFSTEITSVKLATVNGEKVVTIPGLDNYTGTISGSQYTMDGLDSLTIPVEDFFSSPSDLLKDVTVTVGLDSFDLTSATTLVGSISLNSEKLNISETLIAFSGNKNNVPLPGAVWLLGSGVVALFSMVKRRTKA